MFGMCLLFRIIWQQHQISCALLNQRFPMLWAMTLMLILISHDYYENGRTEFCSKSIFLYAVIALNEKKKRLILLGRLGLGVLIEWKKIRDVTGMFMKRFLCCIQSKYVAMSATNDQHSSWHNAFCLQKMSMAKSSDCCVLASKYVVLMA